MVRYIESEIPDAIAPAWIVLTNANEGGSEQLAAVEGDFIFVFPNQSVEARRSAIASAAASLVSSGLCIVHEGSESQATIADHSIRELHSDPASWDRAVIATTAHGRKVWLGGPGLLLQKLASDAA